MTLVIKVKKRPRTHQAIKKRNERYENSVRAALPVIHEARVAGLVNARDFAWFLNYRKVSAPKSGFWSADAVLRALRKLMQLGLDEGSFSPSDARGPAYYNDSEKRYAAIMARDANDTESNTSSAG